VAWVLLLLAAVSEADSDGIPPQVDDSWDIGYDRWERKHSGEFVNGLPERVKASATSVSEAAGDALGEISGTSTPQINCGKAHAANQVACDAYGEHSPVCTGSQASYLLKCGSYQPKALYKQKPMGHSAFLSLLQEQTGIALKQPSNSSNSTVEVEMPEPLKPLKAILEGVLMSCQKHQTESKAICKKSIADKYIEYRKDTGGPPPPPEEDDSVERISEMGEELGSEAGIDRIYKYAMNTLVAHKKKANLKKKGASPSVVPADDVATAAKLAQTDEFFDEMDPLKRIADVEDMAFAGDDTIPSSPDDMTAPAFGPY